MLSTRTIWRQSSLFAYIAQRKDCQPCCIVLFQTMRLSLLGKCLVFFFFLMVLVYLQSPRKKTIVSNQDQHCFELKLIAGFLDDLSTQQLLLYRSVPRVFAPQLEWKNQLKNEPLQSMSVCQLFSPHQINCDTKVHRKLNDKWIIPSGWDWNVYLRYYPEITLQNNGKFNSLTALQHYNEFGQFNGYVPRKINMVLRYTACSGLVNQQYAHIASLSIALLLGAKLIMPPSLQRVTFNTSFDEMPWRQLPIKQVLDMEYVTQYWKEKGLEIETINQWENVPKIDNGEIAFWEDLHTGFDQESHIRFNGIYRRPTPILDLLYRIKTEALNRYSNVASNSGGCLKGIVVDLPCTFFALRTPTALPLVSEVVNSLKFSPRIRNLADQLIQKLRKEWGQFNGVHLRVERDAEDWMTAVGGWSRYIDYYLYTMINVGFSERNGLFLATGLLTYGDTARYKNITGMLIELKLAKQISCKELLLDKNVVDGLEPEISAAVDLLVMLEAEIFVGLDPSTFSFYITQLRKLLGVDATKSHLVQLRGVGTTSLFEEAAVLG
eukprot:TRINITY_DN2734_c2_g1_i1.p1 TRINITY_DN2734_c2_g1~~TRINITY_DN2734_c2_g1_i1.p1  ORF type:complete len:550 (-),score=34.20 TRINITY_DN2734_c2_g1_i1:2-1651(-)